MCLLPVLGKVLERVMIERLQESVSVSASRRQFGFKPGKSVEDAWLHVKNVCEGSASKYVLGVFVDFRGAFDNLCWRGILERLNEVGCEDQLIWSSYLSQREVCGIGRCEVVWRKVERGCPQGSICGPYIWNMMMDTLLGRIERQTEYCAYADDLVLLVEGQSRSDIEKKAGALMRVVSDWGSRSGVDVAWEKTQMMLLRGALSVSRPPCVKVNGKSLQYVKELTYLGIRFGERMNFLPHLGYLRKKLLAVAGKLRRILVNDWGLTRRATRMVYKCLFVPCAAYGAPIWYEVVRTAVGSRKILSVQRVMLLGCVNVCRTVSTEALQVLAGAPPLDLEVIRRTIAFGIRRGLPPIRNCWV
ncbi:MAG: RNA-directed DNA polymerase, partial [Halothiobacillaceae bacterium]